MLRMVSLLLVALLLSMVEAGEAPNAGRRAPKGAAQRVPLYLRVTLGDAYDSPVYVHIFADHYRAPWYQHYSLCAKGLVAAVSPPGQSLLKAKEASPWVDISPMVYEETGARLCISARHTYRQIAPRFEAVLELATAPEEKAVVRTIRADCRPAGVVVIVPGDLRNPESLSRLKIDRDFADQTGRLADGFSWPAFGRRPEQFSFFASSPIGSSNLIVDAAVTVREKKTLSYFGFSSGEGRVLHSHIWFKQNDSYCSPDIERMRQAAEAQAAEFRQGGGSVEDVACCMLTDEPKGQPAEFLAKDPACREAFRAWIRELGKTPADLLVKDWDAVRPVPETERDQFPALHYYTQRFRTVALGRFMAAQRKIVEAAYGGRFPVLANFSDGAIYRGNFYGQGVDYFELLDSEDQNAIWSEDWANAASTYQCASYNVELMRAAARKHGQVLGHHLIAYAGRKSWDIQLKAASEVARGIKALNNFYYGPSWAGHEGGPTWRSTAWYAKPETWTANAEITHQIGAAEDMLLDARPAPAEVAILYSSSTDIWTLNQNHLYGFDRMHTWLALAHAQMPVDILSEQQIGDGMIDKYRVCYLSGPNLRNDAARRLREWVAHGGTLWLTAGAAARDQYNRPLSVLDDVLPADRSLAVELEKQVMAGRNLERLTARDEVRAGSVRMEVLGVKQSLAARRGADVLATFGDGSPALVVGKAGRGRVYCAGFLPALAYIKPALQARSELERRQVEAASGGGTLSPADADRAKLVERSYNPWQFPGGVREFLLQPAVSAKVARPLVSNVPLVDAVYMTCKEGILVPLANYTVKPIDRLQLRIRTPGDVNRVESVRQGPLRYTLKSGQELECLLPLEAIDFIKIYTRPGKK